LEFDKQRFIDNYKRLQTFILMFITTMVHCSQRLSTHVQCWTHKHISIALCKTHTACVIPAIFLG